jgi:Plasmid pRiA4b ORF-3-like protein
MSADESLPSNMIATLRIDLLGSDPPIWREIEVPTSMTLKQLHAVVQAAMGWEDAHLWEFAVGRERTGSSRAAKLTLQALLRPRTMKLSYIYDFGDCWEHQLTLTKPRAADPGSAYPRYLGGEQAAPPEDCGGIPGFYAQLEILAIPNTQSITTSKIGSAASIQTASTNSTSRSGSPVSQTAPHNADQNQAAVISRRLLRKPSYLISCSHWSPSGAASTS